MHALLNTFAVKLVNFLNYVSVWWHILGTGAILSFPPFQTACRNNPLSIAAIAVIIVTVILVKAPMRQSATYVLT